MPSWFQRRFGDIAVVDDGAPPSRRDWILAAALFVASALQLALTPFEWPAARLLVATLAIGLVPFRRQIPLHAAVIAFLAEFVFEVFALSNGIDEAVPNGHLIAGLTLIYAMCRWLPVSRVLVGVVVTTTLVGIPQFAARDSTLDAAFLVFPWFILALFALSMRYRARLLSDRAAMIRLAERNALARELHDSVAHHVSAIAVQAQAAQFVATSNPEGAIENMENIELMANTAIEDMRRMVGVLRSDADYVNSVVATDFSSLNDGGAMPPVTITGQASLDHLPAGVAAAVYRIAQEAVTNARRHSRGVTLIDIEMTTTSSDVDLAIRNDGVPDPRSGAGGYGLIGMRERAESLGGSMTSGTRPNCGWLVHATIPLTRPA